MGKVNNIQQAQAAKDFALDIVKNMINNYGEETTLGEVYNDLAKMNPGNIVGQEF